MHLWVLVCALVGRYYVRVGKLQEAFDIGWDGRPWREDEEEAEASASTSASPGGSNMEIVHQV